MSAASGGTDVLAMGTRAVRDGDVYVLNGSKMWITNGYRCPNELGDVFLVYARTNDTCVATVVVMSNPVGVHAALVSH